MASTTVPAPLMGPIPTSLSPQFLSYIYPTCAHLSLLKFAVRFQRLREI